MKSTAVKQRCPKCGGNLFIANDSDGWYQQCLQCAFTIYLEPVYEKKKQLQVKVSGGAKAIQARKS